MDSTKVVQSLCATQVVEQTTFTAAADVAGSLTGKIMNCTNAQGIVCKYILQVVGYPWSQAITDAVNAPTSLQKYFIVTVPASETAVNIATATRAVVNANSASSDQIAGGSTTAILISNKRGGVAGVASTTDTGFTNVRTQTGTTTLLANAGANAGTSLKYQYFPPTNASVYINEFNLFLGTLVTTTAGVDTTKFANITALGTGVDVQIMNSAGTVKTKLTNLKNNVDISNFSTSYTVLTGAATGAIVACNDTSITYGDSIELDGQLGEYLEFWVQNATTGTGVINFGITGKVVP